MIAKKGACTLIFVILGIFEGLDVDESSNGRFIPARIRWIASFSTALLRGLFKLCKAMRLHGQLSRERRVRVLSIDEEDIYLVAGKAILE